jgi:PIN domain nuclease of toxin-antitoxin system
VKYLLDTYTLLCIITDDLKLSKKVKMLFLDPKNVIFISMASIWEIAIKVSLGKLKMENTLEEFVELHIVGNDIKILNLSLSHLELLEKLPFKHRDPFDRLVICQSIYENIPIITSDKAFKKYKVDSVW